MKIFPRRIPHLTLLPLSLSVKSVISKLIFLPPLKPLHLKITSEKKKKEKWKEQYQRRDAKFKFPRDFNQKKIK